MLMVKSCIMLISSLWRQNSWSLTISLKLVLSAHYPRADAAKLTVLFTVSDDSQLLKPDLRAPKRHIQNLSELSHSFTFPCSCHMVLSCCTPTNTICIFFLANLQSLNDTRSVYSQSVVIIKSQVCQILVLGCLLL